MVGSNEFQLIGRGLGLGLGLGRENSLESLCNLTVFMVRKRDQNLLTDVPSQMINAPHIPPPLNIASAELEHIQQLSCHHQAHHEMNCTSPSNAAPCSPQLLSLQLLSLAPGRSLSMLSITFLPELPTPGVWGWGPHIPLKLSPLPPSPLPRIASQPPGHCPLALWLETHLNTQDLIISLPTRITSLVFISVSWISRAPSPREVLLPDLRLLIFLCIPDPKHGTTNELTQMLQLCYSGFNKTKFSLYSPF